MSLLRQFLQVLFRLVLGSPASWASSVLSIVLFFLCVSHRAKRVHPPKNAWSSDRRGQGSGSLLLRGWSQQDWQFLRGSEKGTNQAQVQEEWPGGASFAPQITPTGGPAQFIS